MTINVLFEQGVEKWPDNIAITQGDRKISYAELNGLANCIASRLITQGAGKEKFVGVVADHSVEMTASILGILKSGASYVAMEPDFPQERINTILSETDPVCIFTDRKYRQLFPESAKLIYGVENSAGASNRNPDAGTGGDSAMYVLFTSGTSGKPKGVIVEHHSVVNYVEAFTEEFGLSQKDRMLQNSVCTFDIFVEEVFPILMKGGTLVIASKEERDDPEKLLGLIRSQGVTIISAFPYLLQELDGYPLPESLRLAVSGGDILRKEYVKNMVRKIPVYNTYGPSETTVCATYYNYIPEKNLSDHVPIGKPVKGAGVYILDKELKEVPQGEQGEICITGRGVSRGYLNRSEETARAFIRNPYDPSERMYRSGDVGMMLEDGNIVFIKRMDDQVMIKGKRVEPLEVEKIISRYEGVDIALVKSFFDPSAYPYLVAYYVGSSDVEPSGLRSFLENYVPEYMIPEYFVRLDEVPKTYSGKIDRKNLPSVKK